MNLGGKIMAESLVCCGKDEKTWCLFLGLIQIKINVEVNTSTLFQPFDLKMCLVHPIYFSSTIFIFINI